MQTSMVAGLKKSNPLNILEVYSKDLRRQSTGDEILPGGPPEPEDLPDADSLTNLN